MTTTTENSLVSGNSNGMDPSHEDGRPLKRPRTSRDSQEQTREVHSAKGLPGSEHSLIPNSAWRDFQELYSANVFAKIWGVAERAFSRSTPPVLFPEYTKPGGVGYVYRELEFWTSGFFPGCLYLLLERRRKYTHKVRRMGLSPTEPEPHELQLE
ncbi:hypothetical protein MGN70_009323 [Eutypa lata]|nr:hypothetical protein MGN70_009323 [Eutypa lata]